MAVIQLSSGIVLHEQARRFVGGGVGWLSIKTFRGGSAQYRLEGRTCTVNDRGFLLLNHGQDYAIEIDSPTPVESLCVFFAPGSIEAALHTFRTSDTHLLDALPVPSPVTFFDRIYTNDLLITALIRGLIVPELHPEARETCLRQIMEALLQLQFNVYRDVERLPAARFATRAEMYRRAHYARDYAHSMFHRVVTLDEMAQAACLSPNHLLRVFRQVFGQTPHEYLTALRLQEAQNRLRMTDEPVTTICHAVGFTSLGSFGSLFQRTFGLSPRAYRRQSR
jgi:AraC-like DNA-binding protein